MHLDERWEAAQPTGAGNCLSSLCQHALTPRQEDFVLHLRTDSSASAIRKSNVCILQAHTMMHCKPVIESKTGMVNRRCRESHQALAAGVARDFPCNADVEINVNVQSL